MVTILIILPKVASAGLLKTKVFWNRVYDIMIYVHDVTKEVLSHDSKYIVDVVMWLKFGN